MTQIKKVEIQKIVVPGWTKFLITNIPDDMKDMTDEFIAKCFDYKDIKFWRNILGDLIVGLKTPVLESHATEMRLFIEKIIEGGFMKNEYEV